MNIKKISFILSMLLAFVLFASSIYAEGDGKNKSNTLYKPQGTPVRTFLDINNIYTVFKYDGISDIDVQEQNSGLVFPKGSGKTAVFQSGFLWGAKVPGDPQPRVGGTAYRTGLVPGKITNSGVPVGSLVGEDQNGADVRIFRVRSDVYPGGPFVDLESDAALEANSASAVRTQYETDWTEWPWQKGAPYFDGNGNNQYDPDPTSGDIPGVTGANQTIWFVANDLDITQAKYPYGAAPLGIEMQATIWAYSQSGALGNMYFRKYKIINKTDGPFNEMYVSMWSDVDLGNSADDFAGCDTLLSLGYSYNANANDPTYNPLPPPAVGFDFFQGPKVNGAYLPMTAFYYFARGDAAVTDPTQGDIQGSTQFYNFFQGKIGLTGNFFVDPNTGQNTTFALSGDPQAKTGWLDGQLLPAGDRRMGMASGPFTMAAGDTQEVVVAEIVAGAIPGVDRISAIGLLKFYDRVAQVAYDNNFDLPTPPPPAQVKVNELANKIILNWGSDASVISSIENSNSKGYVFEGYNVYQLPSASASITEGKRIATYDIVNGFGKIEDLVFDANTGSVVSLPVQFGNDTGIKRYLEITSDALKGGTPIINGIRYYFAVTTYNFNPDPEATPNNLETPLQIITVIPQTDAPGVTLGEDFGAAITATHNGTADGEVNINVVDPGVLTGHDYQIFFTERQEIRDANGDWVPASTMRMFGPDTLTGSSIDIAGVYGPIAGQLELQFVLNLVSVDFDWADGISLTFPAGVTILDAPAFSAGNGDITPSIQGNTVILGDVSGALTTDGPFTGGEEWSIVVDGPLPMPVDWLIVDDGYGGGPVDASGTTTVTAVGNKSRLAKYWNINDATANQVKLQNQSVVNGTDLYPRRDDIITAIGNDAAPITDGFQTYVNIGYAAPTSISQNNVPTVNGADVFSYDGSNVWWDSDNYTVCDFTRFGYPDGFAETTLPLYGNGVGGTTSVDELQKDIEFRWTGVLADTVINGNTLTITASGGSIVTLFGASGYSLADHPLNPSPGTDAPFTIRVPFEVWNLDDNQQINLLMWDRSNDPTSGGEVWFTTNRVYTWLVNTPYSPNLIDESSQLVKDNATWNVVWYLSTFTTGDVVRLNYDNPIQPGVDTYNFNTKASSYSVDLAKTQINEINVFPNPYYGVNSEELNKYNRFVTFSHLPAKATIRIFNLAGVLVKTIQKDDAGQFTRWDLANESGLPVASGLYIAYMDLPDLGETKILKIAIIQEQQILDRF